MSISENQWQSLKHVSKGDFRYPDKLVWGAVLAFDNLVDLIGKKPVVLSDWREYDPKNPNSRHNVGDAIDAAWPNVDSIKLLKQVEDSGLFDGIGIYQNERGAVSFHFDTRGTHARWGGIITHPVDPNTNRTGKQIEYVAMATVVDLIKKKGGLIVLILIGLWLLSLQSEK